VCDRCAESVEDRESARYAATRETSRPRSVVEVDSSIATVVNAVRELHGAPAGDALVSDSVRHVFATGGVALPLLVLAAPRSSRAIAILASLAVGLRLFVVPLAYGPAALVPTAVALVSLSGALGVAAILVAIRALHTASIDTPHPR